MRTNKSYIILAILLYSSAMLAQSRHNMDSLKYFELEKQIDSIVSNAINQEAFPGCVVYASCQDSTVFFKAFGYHTYDSVKSVNIGSIYDLASITKVVGATLSLMKLYEDSLIHLDDPISVYLDGLGRKVGNVTIREALAHQGGLYPWIPYYQRIKRKNGQFRRRFISGSPNEVYPFELSDSLYLRADFYKTIKKYIKKSRVADDPSYKYSGLFFYLIPELVEKLSGTKYEVYLDEHFFQPLQLSTMGFQPLKRFTSDLIVPTEIDTFFRMKQIHGEVHDEGAIMMRGVSGNVGLISNAKDLAVIMNVLSNNGRLDSIQILEPQTIDLFNTVHYPNLKNRRGLGFDKPLLTYDSVRSSVARSVSRHSFGHTGYTGTLAWSDPENKIVFIFLSNRVYPSRKNTAIYRLNVRPTIHQLLYDYLESERAGKGLTGEKWK